MVATSGARSMRLVAWIAEANGLGRACLRCNRQQPRTTSGRMCRVDYTDCTPMLVKASSFNLLGIESIQPSDPCRFTVRAEI
eukprot:4245164-Amphidinium_carterae.1